MKNPDQADQPVTQPTEQAISAADTAPIPCSGHHLQEGSTAASADAERPAPALLYVPGFWYGGEYDLI